MREVTRFVVVFPTRLMAKSYDEKKALMDALRREYPHYLFEAVEAFEGGGPADDDDFIIIPITGHLGEGEGDRDEVVLCSPLDPTVIPELVKRLLSYDSFGVTAVVRAALQNGQSCPSRSASGVSGSAGSESGKFT